MAKARTIGNIKVEGTAEEWGKAVEDWKTHPRGVYGWLTTMKVKNEAGTPMEWEDRRFLVDIACDMHPKQVIVKCSQVGLSTVMILKSRFVAQIKAMPVIYTLPTDKLLSKFIGTKIVPMWEKNAQLDIINPTISDTKELQRYKNAAYVVFGGTMGANDDISLTAAVVISDEVDKSDLDVVEGLESRTMASKYRGTWWFTNPTIPGHGADKKYQLSDKREWHITCPECGEVQYLDYWENVDKELKQFVCRSCHAVLSDDVRRHGKWIPTVTEIDGAPPRWHGYHISHLIAPWITAADIIEAEETKDKSYFYNFVLGLPCIEDGYAVDRTLILSNVVPEEDPRRKLKGAHKFMGVDVGRVLHVEISDEYGVRKLACLGDDKGITPKERADMTNPKSKWGKLRQLFLAEQINMCVIDNGPADKQADFQRMFPYKVYRCIYDYNEKRKADIFLDRKEGVVNVHRTRIIDTMVDEYGRQERPLFLDGDDPYLDGSGTKKTDNCLSAHWAAFYVTGMDGEDKNEVKKDRAGNVIRAWVSAGADHFGHADIYNKVAQVIGGGGTGSSFMLGDFKSKPKVEEEEDDFPGKDENEPSFYSM